MGIQYLPCKKKKNEYGPMSEHPDYFQKRLGQEIQMRHVCNEHTGICLQLKFPHTVQYEWEHGCYTCAVSQFYTSY